jgi:hypothetical protein
LITQTVYCGVFTFVEKLAGLFLEYKIINPFNLNLKFYSEILRSPLGGQSIVHQVALMYENCTIARGRVATEEQLRFYVNKEKTSTLC